ncbi:PrsW family intramembrane metalloprotease [Clostridium tagluense]|uniref:PrsW family intramembrane metalloprotease n=2 Tax=Clostridium tagluense TaxID=360422 RepID=UPI001C0B9183|nr:PrsW family glutamic-type intramembrane protease [Clostridium tagluense]MBU3128379.1 PrsW family intramembrane metalloprotease [Clostridium tagluense]MCB2311512.1 PrsW family intramembrane metalloprotease [Clostridium tagluense]MCB2335688.1 PrsW family intramembrane metalloprotease [Clostridium tagluense]MCB2364481.1 PrsW family intramembrane metalloprotease [Clostridium tagluense]
MKNMEKVTTKKRYKWWRLLIIGLILYIVGLGVLVLTRNQNLFPSIVMLGNFLIPVIYVAFLYQKRTLSNVSMPMTLAGFFYGGFLGVFAAAMLEPIFIQNLNFSTAMFVGIIEEFAKIVGVLVIFRNRNHDLQLDGLIIGAAAGMGFAALESSGYAFATFIKSGGSLSATVYITLLRGILSPLGHGTWTAILAAVLLRESAPRKFTLNIRVIGAYVTVVLLHGLWNGIPSVIGMFTASPIAIFIGQFIIGILGILILIRLWFKAKKQARERLTRD